MSEIPFYPNDEEDAALKDADAQVLADMRTLDAFNPNWQMALSPDGGHYCLPRGDALAFDGPTPEDARHKAAKWVRGLP